MKLKSGDKSKWASWPASPAGMTSAQSCLNPSGEDAGLGGCGLNIEWL
eukprot:CAMPEP_0198488882 /NCGR_PEP_ID=MMETSP1462-20131121/1063_1 /TAXON_ID=1333877 /ORGANISM="Brandtodinium nutriculum, Strain RCC3387" /LENGTH=47 /DNA_ID= /DNA_START= /DNA_END= /DNA_ORIENTATION=